MKKLRLVLVFGEITHITHHPVLQNPRSVAPPVGFICALRSPVVM